MHSGATAERELPSASARADPPVIECRPVALWLLACCAMLFALIVVGGVTRLTHSGLSMVEWQPLIGVVPPLNQDQWLEVFAKYQETPEFRQVNFDMGLEEFKGIFWWEYVHRLLGRLMGLAFLLPYVVFLLRGRLRGTLAWKLAGVFALGALQGAMGWYMVKSGLVDDPRVSHYRLTAHLGLAFLIYAPMLWIALDLLLPARNAPFAPVLARLSLIVVVLVFATAITGGLVAGTRAGLAYNTFPLMNGALVPPQILMLEPLYVNFFDNIATVQFDHRLLAWLLVFLVPWFWWRSVNAELVPRARLACHLLLAGLALQLALGIATLLLRVPLALAAAHQAGAVLLFTASLFAAHALRRD
ncbi:MAG: COX15/CtaA family protein [Betaproteobacteria bacterium]|nr:COX15/CtaA family protein [Betaproteobacteria bacterium]MBI2961390.1 COX15/CtaA family protein [Betaproteobacteria bacterium]